MSEAAAGQFALFSSLGISPLSRRPRRSCCFGKNRRRRRTENRSLLSPPLTSSSLLFSSSPPSSISIVSLSFLAFSPFSSLFCFLFFQICLSFCPAREKMDVLSQFLLPSFSFFEFHFAFFLREIIACERSPFSSTNSLSPSSPASAGKLTGEREERRDFSFSSEGKNSERES